MGPLERETSHSFLFLKMNTENLNAYIIYTRHACMVSLRFTGPGKFVGWETRKGEGNRRRYQGPETGGKPSAAVTQTEQTEGNTPVHKHLSRYVYTEKVISIFALKASRSHRFSSIQFLFVLKIYSRLYHLPGFSLFWNVGTHIGFVRAFISE